MSYDVKLLIICLALY